MVTVSSESKNDSFALSLVLLLGTAGFFSFLHSPRNRGRRVVFPDEDISDKDISDEDIPDEDIADKKMPNFPLSFNFRQSIPSPTHRKRRGSIAGSHVSHHFDNDKNRARGEPIPVEDRRSFMTTPSSRESFTPRSIIGNGVSHHFDSDSALEWTVDISSSTTEKESDYHFKYQDITHICEPRDSEVESGTTLNPVLNAPTYEWEEENETKSTRPKLTPQMSCITNNSVTNYSQSRNMPRRVTMIRHGESEGNVDPGIYQTKADNALGLTELGWVQARMAGQALREQITKQDSEDPIHFVISPYVRTMETFHGIASAWCDPEEYSHIVDEDARLAAWYARLQEEGLTWHEDPRIREQDFGNYQDINAIKKAKSERHEFSAFYYRFLNGESASDVFDRVSTFLDSLWRSFNSHNSVENYVLVTHGISIRVLLSRYFRYTVDQYNMMKNPKNCEMIFLGHDGAGSLDLDGRCYLESEKRLDNTGRLRTSLRYKFDKILNIAPKKHFKKRVIRMSYKEEGIE